MSTNYYYDEGLLEHGFPSNEQPENALIRIRRELDGRLTWLEHYLTPDKSGSARPGKSLVDRGLLDKDIFSTIVQVVNAGNQFAHGRSVDTAGAAAIVETGFQMIELLDRLISSTRVKIKGLKPEARLVYRFLELPTSRREKISRDYNVFMRARDSESRIKQARAVLKEAQEHETIRQLWDAIAAASLDQSAESNPFDGEQHG